MPYKIVDWFETVRERIAYWIFPEHDMYLDLARILGKLEENKRVVSEIENSKFKNKKEVIELVKTKYKSLDEIIGQSNVSSEDQTS